MYDQRSADTDAILVIDLQTDMFSGTIVPPIYDAEGIIDRVRAVVAWARRTGRKVAFIRHDGPIGDTLAPGQPGWPLWPALERAENEPVFSKSVRDAFTQPLLLDWIARHNVKRVIVTGAQTDFCVAATVQGALTRGLHVTVIEDAHSTWDLEGEPATAIVARHNVSFASSGVAVVPTESVTCN